MDQTENPGPIGEAPARRERAKPAPLADRVYEQIVARIASGEFRPVDPSLTVKCIVGPLVLAAIWKSVFVPIGAEPINIGELVRHHADFILRALRP